MSAPERAVGTATLDRRGAAALIVVGGAVLAGAAWLLVPWAWVPGGRLVPASASDSFGAAELARADAYAASVRRLGLASFAVSLLVVAAVGLTPLGSRLVRRLLAGRWWVSTALVVALVLLLRRGFTLPLAHRARQHALDAGLTEQTTAAWLADQGRGLLVSWVALTLVVLLLLGAARRWPRRWFLAAGSGLAGMTLLASAAYPLVVEPLFNDFTELPEGPLRTQVLELAAREGVSVEEVLVADASRRTTTLNAYVSGLGASRRVVVYDTLLREAPPREVLSVVAHELGHARHHDVAVGTGLGAGAALVGVTLLALVWDSRAARRWAGLRGRPDATAVPMLLALLALGSAASLPAQNVVSRALEARADREALAATGDPAAFVAVQRRLARRSLADPDPPRWVRLVFGSHPTTVERLGLPRSLELAERAGRAEDAAERPSAPRSTSWRP